MGVWRESLDGRRREGRLCTGCARVVPERADFCPHCGAPLGPYCWLDPWKEIRSEGYVYQRMATGRIGAFAFYTAFTLLGIAVAVTLLFFATGFGDLDFDGTRPLIVLNLVLWLAIGGRMVINFRRRQAQQDPP